MSSKLTIFYKSSALLLALIIGISGGSGSGKTTFLKTLEDRLSNQSVSFISFDDYYRPREEQFVDPKGIKNFDLPSSMDIDEFVKDLKALQSGQSVSRQQYTFNNENSTSEELTISPANVIIVEGLFIYHYEALKKMFDVKLFVDAKDELKIIRRIKRDRTERNYPLEDVLYRYEHHVLPSFRKYIEPYKSEMDIIINNNDQFSKAIEIVVAYITSVAKD